MRNTRKTVAVSSAPPEELPCSFLYRWRASAPFALLRNTRKTVAVRSAPPEERACSLTDGRRASRPLCFCGTSGFAYDSWRPGFYPENLPSSKFLSHYATRLNAVEANYTYRRLASASTFEKWIHATPPGFVFLPKAHMKITHSLKLAGAEEFTRLFLESLNPLQQAGRLGPILFQLPPSLSVDIPRLAEFLTILPPVVRAAFEFRNATWFTERVYETLQSANAALCLAENENLETPHVLTADFVYLRLRKPEYSESELGSIGYRIDQYRSNGYPTYAIFKHEETPAGALNAERILKGAFVS